MMQMSWSLKANSRKRKSKSKEYAYPSNSNSATKQQDSTVINEVSKLVQEDLNNNADPHAVHSEATFTKGPADICSPTRHAVAPPLAAQDSSPRCITPASPTEPQLPSGLPVLAASPPASRNIPHRIPVQNPSQDLAMPLPPIEYTSTVPESGEASESSGASNIGSPVTAPESGPNAEHLAVEALLCFSHRSPSTKRPPDSKPQYVKPEAAHQQYQSATRSSVSVSMPASITGAAPSPSSTLASHAAQCTAAAAEASALGADPENVLHNVLSHLGAGPSAGVPAATNAPAGTSDGADRCSRLESWLVERDRRWLGTIEPEPAAAGAHGSSGPCKEVGLSLSDGSTASLSLLSGSSAAATPTAISQDAKRLKRYSEIMQEVQALARQQQPTTSADLSLGGSSARVDPSAVASSTPLSKKAEARDGPRWSFKPLKQQRLVPNVPTC